MWPVDASRALLAEVGHLQRIAELLPKLETELVATLLLDAPAVPGRAPVSTPLGAPTLG